MYLLSAFSSAAEWNDDAARTDKPKGLAKTIQKIGTFINEFDDWFLKHQGFNYPNIDGGIETVKKDVILAAWDTVDLSKLSTPFYILLKTNHVVGVAKAKAKVVASAVVPEPAKSRIGRRQKKLIKSAQATVDRRRKGTKKK